MALAGIEARRRCVARVVGASIGAAVLAGLLALGGCFDSSEATLCTTADDCSAPFLCCVGGVVVQIEGASLCVIPDPSLAFCDAYLPHLVEGNPCGRVPVDESSVTVGAGYDPPPAAADQCRDGLTCCASTLTCTPVDGCGPPEDLPADAASSGITCHADDECPASQVCCGISYYQRDGSCTLVRDCPLASSPAGG